MQMRSEMEQFVRSQQTVPVEHDPFVGEPIVVTFPTTDPQREVWLSSQMGDDASCAYNESVSLRLVGVLDRALLENAVMRTVERHGSLRSVFSASGTQMIELAESKARFEFHDIQPLSGQKRAEWLAALDRRMMTTPFDLTNGPLFRPILIQMGAEEHVLRFVAHHSVCDGWSLGIIMADVSRIYSALIRGTQPELPDAIPYSRYALEMEEYQTSEDYERVKDYWLKLYEGAVPRTDLPTDRPRPTTKTYAAARLDLPLSTELVTGLKQLGIRFGSSLVTTLLTTFELLVARKTGQSDLVIGLPAAGQSDMGMKELVGHCVSLLPLRTILDHDESFSEHLKKRRSAVLDAYDHQRFTLGTLLQDLDVPREPGRVPLAPVVFNIDMNMDDGVAFEGLRHVYSSDPRFFEHFELALNCAGKDDHLVLEWGYNTDLFDATTIRAWMDELVVLVQRICADPSITLGQAIGDTEDGSAAIPVPKEWSGSLVPLAPEVSIWSIFEQVVTNHGNKVAVVQGNTELTYTALRDRALRLSARLSGAGLKQGDLVGVFTTPGTDMIVALLATLRAGAAYLPIDPNYPKERVTQVLEDARVKRVLTLPALASLLPNKDLVVMIGDGSNGVATPGAPAVMIGPSDAAYVIYTSGSTGTPKGVVVPHRGVVRLVDPASFIAFGPDLVWLHHLSISFDASMVSIWGALLNGGRLAIPVDAKPSLNDLADTMLLHKVNAIATASGLFDLLVEERIDALKGLRHLITGGDVISLRHARKVLTELGPGVLVNAYGPTENSVVSTCFVLRDEHELERALPIGKPFRNSTAYVLDERMRPVGIGQRGELYTGGPGTALGYLNRPELTAERFVKDPFNPGGLMYRTGDMVRWLPNGDLEFFGRADEQVKIRGFRIELGEIDAALNDLAAIGSQAVICAATGQGDKEILAYVVPAEKRPLDETTTKALEHAVIEHLSKKLPEYMLPSAVVVMDAMPLNNSGKVDKAKLPRPIRGKAPQHSVHTPPLTDLERALAGIWSKLLHVENIGIHDNFFELGGHSLIGLQMFAQVERQLGARLQLKTLFQAPTIAQLTELIAKDTPGQQWKNLIAIQPNGSRIPFFCVHGDEANHYMPPYLGQDQPFYGFAHQGEDGMPIRFTTVKSIAQHLISEMRTVRPRGPYFLGGYSFGGIVAFEMAQQLVAAGEEVPLLVMLDSYDPIEYRAVMKREAKLHEPVKNFLLSRLIKQLASDDKPLPHRLRHFNIIQTYDQAMKDYNASPYNGKITLFRSKLSTGPLEMGWTPVAKGGVDVHLIEGDHFDMMKDAQVRLIASKLTDLIAERSPRAVMQAS